MLAAALLNYADDDGYFNANHRLIKGELFPLRELSVSIPEALSMLSEIGYLRFGDGVDSKRYGQIIKFCDHQVINRKTESKIKNIEIAWDDSRITHGSLSDDSHLEGKGKEGKGKDQERAIARDDSPSFEGTVVRLNSRDFAKWVKAFPKLDLFGELTARDAWLTKAPPGDRENWFISTSNYLANRNMEAGAKRAALNPAGQPRRGIEGIV